MSASESKSTASNAQHPRPSTLPGKAAGNHLISPLTPQMMPIEQFSCAPRRDDHGAVRSGASDVGASPAHQVGQHHGERRVSRAQEHAAVDERGS